MKHSNVIYILFFMLVLMSIKPSENITPYHLRSSLDYDLKVIKCRKLINDNDKKENEVIEKAMKLK